MIEFSWQKISGWEFIFYWLYYWNLNLLVKQLDAKYSPSKNYQVSFFWGYKILLIIQTPTAIKTILSSKTHELTYINQNFNLSHGHSKTINNFNSSDIQWSMIHTSLKKAANQNKEWMEELLKTTNFITFKNEINENEIKLDQVLEKYLLTVWAKFCFGSDINTNQYSNLRQKMLFFLSKTYYSHQISWIPYLGSLWCSLKYWYYKKEFLEIDRVLELDFINPGLAQKKGFFYSFSYFISEYIDQHNLDDSDYNKIISDNAFLSILVYDFIYKILLDTMLRLSCFDPPYSEHLFDSQLEKAFNSSFLYPFRYRYSLDQIVLDQYGEYIIQKGQTIMLNLCQPSVYFSWGPRSCIGQNLVTQTIIPYFKEQICHQRWQFQLSNTGIKQFRSCLNHNKKKRPNIPFLNRLEGSAVIHWKGYPRTYLQKNIRCYKFKGVIYKQILSIYENPDLFRFIVKELSSGFTIADQTPCDGIISPEVRGLSLAGAMAFYLNVPLYTIRKKGKLPGETHSLTYDTAYSQDTIEFSSDVNLQNKKLILVDDGIASGGTAIACIELVELKCQGIIIAIRAMVNHTYCLNDSTRIKYDNKYSAITKTLFDL